MVAHGAAHLGLTRGWSRSHISGLQPEGGGILTIAIDRSQAEGLGYECVHRFLARPSPRPRSRETDSLASTSNKPRLPSSRASTSTVSCLQPPAPPGRRFGHGAVSEEDCGRRRVLDHRPGPPAVAVLETAAQFVSLLLAGVVEHKGLIDFGRPFDPTKHRASTAGIKQLRHRHCHSRCTDTGACVPQCRRFSNMAFPVLQQPKAHAGSASPYNGGPAVQTVYSATEGNEQASLRDFRPSRCWSVYACCCGRCRYESDPGRKSRCRPRSCDWRSAATLPCAQKGV